jgi:hypothetical protein
VAHVEPAPARDPPSPSDASSRLPSLAWPLGILGLLISVTVATLAYLNRSAIHGLDQADPIEMLLPIGYSIMGALLASRRPRNPIGWIFLGIAIFGGLPGIATQYVIRSTHIHRLPFVAWVAWTHDWVGWLVFPGGLAAFFFLLFPDGHLASRRWRWLARFAVAVVVLGIGVFMTQRTIELTGSRGIRNPIGLAAVDVGNGPLGYIWIVGLLVLVAAMVGTILRTRRASGELRQQLRWLSYATFATAAAMVLVIAFQWFLFPSDSGVAFDACIVLGYGVAIPVSCGVAILKYRLYEIDRIIRRTATYGLLTAVLVGIYAALVVGVGSALGTTNDPFLIAGSTLLVAALVGPLRRRIQLFLDRRFARRRYDAAGILATFSSGLRDEVDLDDVRGLLRRAVVETVRPARVGIWIKGEPRLP